MVSKIVSGIRDTDLRHILYSQRVLSTGKGNHINNYNNSVIRVTIVMSTWWGDGQKRLRYQSAREALGKKGLLSSCSLYQANQAKVGNHLQNTLLQASFLRELM